MFTLPANIDFPIFGSLGKSDHLKAFWRYLEFNSELKFQSYDICSKTQSVRKLFTLLWKNWFSIFGSLGKSHHLKQFCAIHNSIPNSCFKVTTSHVSYGIIIVISFIHHFYIIHISFLYHSYMIFRSFIRHLYHFYIIHTSFLYHSYIIFISFIHLFYIIHTSFLYHSYIIFIIINANFQKHNLFENCSHFWWTNDFPIFGSLGKSQHLKTFAAI